MTPEDLQNWPGKTAPEGAHPALWHMLDVAAVATVLLRNRPLTATPQHERAAAFLIALHDLGKFSENFRAMLNGAAPSGMRHWRHSYWLLKHFDARLGEMLGGTPELRNILAAAVAGHHGGPPAPSQAGTHAQHQAQIGPAGMAMAEMALEALHPLFADASLNGLDEAAARRLSWVLSGLTVQADWIGSNSAWFGVRRADIPVLDYWQQAQMAAETAVAKAGLFQAKPQVATNLLGGFTPRPMQAAAQTVALPPGPVLALMEDATGAGKTEAALMLASRMMAAGKATGVYFALPTMATSNAMLARMEPAASQMFAGRPSLALTHGKAAMNPLFDTLKSRSDTNSDTPFCGEWLADDRRRVLLADIGVGTLDQALLSVLPTRFNTLRLRALSGQVLIIDEAHAYDPYMEKELQRLLHFHALLGGSAIVMTATLPMAMRNGYAHAFHSGRRQREGAAAQPARRRNQPSLEITSTAYPALSLVAKQVDTRAPAPVPATVRDINVTRLDAPEAAIAVLKDAVAKGAACVWVRNAVDEAISAVQALAQAGIAADLLHARFCMADRLRHETALQQRFGREGRGRAGRVLVATQVVEASLDLDFDLMITDLAPIGALIQRAGRLWRHMDLRPAKRRPVPGPTLHILSPDPAKVPDAHWLRPLLGGGAFVYPVDAQWRTAEAVFAVGVIRAPDGLRPLIEAVHGDSPAPLPPALLGAESETLGRALSERAQAQNNLLDPYDHYNQAAMRRVFDDLNFPTRLGQPQTTLRLARQVAGALRPLHGNWQQAEVQLSTARYAKLAGVEQADDLIEATKASWPEWMRNMIVLAPVADDGTICEGLRYDEKLGLLLAPG